MLKKAAAEAGNKEVKKERKKKQAINHSGKPLFKQLHRTTA